MTEINATARQAPKLRMAEVTFVDILQNIRRSKMMKVRTTLLALSAAALFSSAGWAQQGPVAAACKDDIPKYCAGKEHGGGEVRACLEASRDKVSAQCKTALDTTGPGKGMGQGPGRQ